MMIGILTFHKSVNYGSVLQCWALQRALTLEGYTPQIIDYEPEKYGEMYDVFLKPGTPRFLIRNLNRLPVSGILQRQKSGFARFRRDHLPVGPVTWHHDDDYTAIGSQYDAIICGSDQIWNVSAADADKIYFLPFDAPCRKLAYAVSLNTGSFDSLEDPGEKETYRQWISDFDYLSCRETDGVEKLRELLGGERPVDLALDPTLLHDKKEYARITSPRRIRERYIFVYYVWYDESIVRAAREIGRRTGLPVYTIEMAKGGRTYLKLWKKGIRPVTRALAPGDYLSLIRHAAYVVTDSFHGTAFSIIFEKKFVSINDGSPERGYKNDVRISGILDKLGLGGRFVTCEQLEQLDLDEPIDYRAVTRTRKQLARQCMKRLTDALKG